MADSQVGPSWFVPADNTKPEAPASSTGSSGASWFVPANETQKSDPLPPKVKDRFDKTKADFGKALSPHIGIPPGDIYAKADTVAKAVDGPKATPQSFWGKIKNTDSAIGLRHMKDELAGQLMLAKPGYDAVALSRQYQEVKKKLDAIKPEDQLGGFGSTLINMAEGLGYQVRHEAGTVGADVAGFMMGEVWDKALGFEPTTHLLKAGQGEADKVFGTVSGQTYGDLIDKGIDPKVARGVAAGVGVFNVAAWAVPGGRTPGVQKLLEEATTEGLLKASLKGVVIGDIAKGVGKQGAYGAIYSTINAISPYVAEAVQKRESLWKAMGTNSGEVLKEIGVGAGLQAVIGGSAEAVGAVVHGSKLAAAIDKAKGEVDAHPEVLPNENVGGASKPGAPKADQFIDEAAKDRQMAAAAKDHVAAMPIGDLDKPIPYEDVPRETPKTGGPVVDPLDKQVAKDPRVVTAKAQVPADSNRVSNIENQVYQEKFTEQHPAVVEAKKALQVALDDPTQADKVASLTEAFQSARKEANMMAAERGTQRVARERARVERVATRNKAIDQLKGVNPDIMSKESGDVVRAIQDHFFPEKEAKARARGATLDLDALKKNLDEAKDRVSPSIDLEALGKLPKNIRDIPPEDFQTIVDAVKNHDLIRKMEGKIRTVEGDIRRATFQESAEKDIGEPKKSILGDKAAEIRDQLRTGVKTLTDSPEYLGEWAFGGKRTPTYEAVTAGPERAKPHVEPRAHSYKSEAKAIAKATLGIDKRDFSEADSIKWNKYYGEEFTEDGVTLNRNDIMDSYMHFLNENNKKSLLEGGTKFTSKSVRERFKEGKQRISEDTYQKLFKHLTPSDHLVLEAAGRMTEKTGADINSKYHVPKYGFPMTIEDHYWPKDTVNEGKSYEEDIQDIQKAARKLDGSGLNKGMLKKRTGDTGAIYTHGFWSTLERHANDAALLTEMGPAYDAAHEVLHDQKVSDRLSAVHSPELTATLQRALERTAGQHETSHGLEKGLDTAGNVATNLMLGSVKTLTVVPKMLALGARSMVKNPVAGVQAFVDMTLHPRVTREEARMLSPRVDTAYRKGTTLDQTQLKRLQTKTGVVRAIGRKVQRANMAAVKWSSMESYLFDATVAKRQVELESRNVERWNDRLETARRMQATANTPHEKVLAQSMVDKAQKGFDESMSDDVVGATGMTPKDVLKASPEAMTKAKGDYGNNIIGETHATNDPMHMVGLQTTALGRIATKFATEPLKAGEVIRRTIMQVHRAPTFSNVSRLTRTLAFYGIAEGAIFYGVKEAKDLLLGKKPSKQAARETEWQKLGGEIARADISMVGGGQQIQQVIDTKKYPYSAHGGAVEETIRMPIEMVVNAITAVTGATAKERGAAVKQMLKMARSYVGLAADITDMGAK